MRLQCNVYSKHICKLFYSHHSAHLRFLAMFCQYWLAFRHDYLQKLEGSDWDTIYCPDWYAIYSDKMNKNYDSKFVILDQKFLLAS